MAKKEFKAGLYGVVAGVLIAAILVGMTIFAFTSRYNGFSSEKIAQSYADTIVQTGDGYNALKISLVSKNQKFGNFVIDGYMAPYINEDGIKNEEIGKGSEKEAQMLDEVYNTMYDYFLGQMATVGLENYDVFYSNYFAKLKEVREAVIGDNYMDTEFMFSVFESNVNKYGEFLTGTEEKLAADGKTVLQEATTGVYQEKFGADYKLTTTVTETKSLSADELEAYKDGYKIRISNQILVGKVKAEGLDTDKKEAMESAFDKLDVTDDINAVDVCTVEVTDQNGNAVATAEINVVKIGNSWYVDNTNSSTASLYL